VDRVAACGYGLAALPLVLSHAGLLTVPVLTAFAAPMAFRRSRPLLSLAVLITGLAAVGAWRSELLPVGMVALAYVLYAAAGLRCRPAVLALAAAVCAAWAPALPDFRHLGGTVLFTLVYLITWMAGFLVGLHRRHTADLLRGQAMAAAAELAEQRVRIARELHDAMAHSMSVITVQAGYGALVIGDQPEAAREALTAIETTGRQTLTEIRRMLGMLRSSDGGPELAPAPGIGDLEHLVARTTAAGVRVELTVTGSQRTLPAGISICAYRIVQEALANVVRHAAADAARVAVAYRDGELAIEVTDTGRGDRGPGAGPGAGPGHGITGMRERAQLYGGQLEAGPLPGGGFRVLACLPLELEPAG
jgi:signal transduction histidine kinase